MQGVLNVSGRVALVKIRITTKASPAGASVEVTDVQLQPGASVSGWLPHVTELPWSAGIKA